MNDFSKKIGQNSKFNLYIILAFCCSFGAFAQSPAKIENQYTADQGNGTYLNPILKGNYADPTVLRDGADYYMTHSSFTNLPGLLIWHSKDLVNWEPFANALTDFVGEVWAPDLIKYNGLFYIYFPAGGSNWVVTAKNMKGPWSKPVDLKIGGIDPGHVASQDGKRYLNFAGGDMVLLADDGLSIVGDRQRNYGGWIFPKDWIVECSCLESPKFTYHNGYYYITAAEGGTAGPPTSHMAIMARSKTPFGPWENSPYNPVVHNSKRTNQWASTGHATIVDTPDGKWWIVYHGFESTDRTIGRQTLLMPLEETKDGWFKVPDGINDGEPIPMPKGEKVAHGMQLSDSFEGTKLNSHWNVIKNYKPERYKIANGTLTMTADGDSPVNTVPLTIMPANNSYEVSVQLAVDKDASGGILLYYNGKYYSGLSLENKSIYRLSGNGGRNRYVENIQSDKVWLKVVNDHHIVLYYYSLNGEKWSRIDFANDVTGLNTNTFSDWGYLRPGIFSVGKGSVKFKDFQYRGLKE